MLRIRGNLSHTVLDKHLAGAKGCVNNHKLTHEDRIQHADLAEGEVAFLSQPVALLTD